MGYGLKSKAWGSSAFVTNNKITSRIDDATKNLHLHENNKIFVKFFAGTSQI
jgi:hypothetical protein